MFVLSSPSLLPISRSLLFLFLCILARAYNVYGKVPLPCPYFTAVFILPHIFPSLFYFCLYLLLFVFFQTGDYERVRSWLELASTLRARLLRVRNHSVTENNWTQARVPAHYPQIIASWGTLTGYNNDFGEFGLPLWWKLSVWRSQNRDMQHATKHDTTAQGSLIYARSVRKRLRWWCVFVLGQVLCVCVCARVKNITLGKLFDLCSGSFVDRVLE